MPLLSPEYLLRVLLVFVRIGGLFVASPFFSQQMIPVQVRVLLSALLAYSLAGFATGPLPPHVTHPAGFILALVVEAGTGLLLGFAAQFIFWAVQFAGDIMGFQMGLSLARVYNPVSGVATNPLGQILTLTFLLVFLMLDGHHLLLRALVGSFDVVPLAGARLTAGGPLLLEWTGAFFTTALRLAAPFMITLFLVDVALGVFARVVPQADLFSLSLPLKLIVGLGVFAVFMQNLLPAVPALVESMLRDLTRLIEVLAPV